MTSPTDMTRAWVDIDLRALVANARTIGDVSHARLLPMVKANGYGLGAVAVAGALDPLDPWGYGVATVAEAMALRAGGIERPILVVSPLTDETLETTSEQQLRPAIGDPATLRRWLSRSSGPFHLEIDTGMGRAGIRWNDTSGLAEAAAALRDSRGWEGAFTHFHSADSDSDSVATQWGRLQSAMAALPQRTVLVHAANSAASLCGRDYAADLVRPGIFLYGGSAGAGKPMPHPVAALRARVVAVRRIAAGESASYGAAWTAPRDTTVATLGIGYADGMLRAAGPAGDVSRREVELRGRRVPVVGRVTMDMTMVAVDDGEVAMGDVATIFGGLVSLDEQATRSGTISYELLTALGHRLPRRYQ